MCSLKVAYPQPFVVVRLVFALIDSLLLIKLRVAGPATTVVLVDAPNPPHLESLSVMDGQRSLEYCQLLPLLVMQVNPSLPWVS